ncbi:hypothetical protein [Nocardia wallacei]|uniref:hypothetical protein n=1 Tax=Nocardia wallacei TaxID=480035 RepID=UPI002455F18A|nr:hypothetical protein [Nocardia wallacei]
MHKLAAPRQLDWVDWLSVISSVIAIATVVWFMAGLIAKLRNASIRQAAQELDLLIRRPWHIVALILIATSSALLIAFPPPRFPFSLLWLIPITTFFLLLLSFFLLQNDRLARNVLLHEMRKAIERANKKRNQPCSAIRFDIDLIVAINDYSYAVGTRVVEPVTDAVTEQAKRLRREGIDVTLVNIPEAAEVVLLLPGLSVEESADIADEVRRRVKAGLPRIPYYQEACEFVARKLQNPPLTDEEKHGIGTVSAGVAAYTRGEEGLLSDISSAVKEAKFRGRNKTIIYRQGGDSTVRSDYQAPS